MAGDRHELYGVAMESKVLQWSIDDIKNAALLADKVCVSPLFCATHGVEYADGVGDGSSQVHARVCMLSYSA